MNHSIQEIETHEVCADLGLARDRFFCASQQGRSTWPFNLGSPNDKRVIFCWTRPAGDGAWERKPPARLLFSCF